jgi:hypothetical protein
VAWNNIFTEEIEMRSSMEKSQVRKRLAVLVALLCALVSIPVLSSAAGTGASSAQPMLTIGVTNNATRDIYHLYLSPVDHDAWGPDLMTEGTVLKTGETFNINDVSCGSEIKVIAEDKQGCFVYGVVGCGQESTNWTITNDMPADCGN